MAENRGGKPPHERVAEPVSEFIRWLIERWEADGKLLKTLAAEAGLAKSMPSQIKARTSDASFYSASKLAVPLGYRDLPDLVTAAYAWWRSKDRSRLPESTAESPIAEGMRVAMNYGVTQAQIDRAIGRVQPPEIRERLPAGEWLRIFLDEHSNESRFDAELKAHVHDEETKRKREKKQRDEIRRIEEETAAKRPKKKRAS